MDSEDVPSATLALLLEVCYVSNDTLRAVYGRDAALELLVKSGDHYAVEADLIDADVWRFQPALADAVAAGEDAEAAMGALGTTIGIYRHLPWQIRRARRLPVVRVGSGGEDDVANPQELRVLVRAVETRI